MLPALQNDRNGCHLLTSSPGGPRALRSVRRYWRLDCRLRLVEPAYELAHCPKAHDQVPD